MRRSSLKHGLLENRLFPILLWRKHCGKKVKNTQAKLPFGNFFTIFANEGAWEKEWMCIQLTGGKHPLKSSTYVCTSTSMPIWNAIGPIYQVENNKKLTT